MFYVHWQTVRLPKRTVTYPLDLVTEKKCRNLLRNFLKLILIFQKEQN